MYDGICRGIVVLHVETAVSRAVPPALQPLHVSHGAELVPILPVDLQRSVQVPVLALSKGGGKGKIHAHAHTSTHTANSRGGGGARREGDGRVYQRRDKQRSMRG